MTTTSRARRIITAAAFGAAILAATTACTTLGVAPTNPGITNNPAAATATPTITGRVMGTTTADAVPLGTKLTSTEADITIHAVEPFTPRQYTLTKPGVAVDVEVDYTTPGAATPGSSNNPLTVSVSDIDAVDTQGHVYRAAWTTDREPAFPITSKAYPGDITRGWVVIETPLAPADLIIRAQLSNGHYHWRTT